MPAGVPVSTARWQPPPTVHPSVRFSGDSLPTLSGRPQLENKPQGKGLMLSDGLFWSLVLRRGVSQACGDRGGPGSEGISTERATGSGERYAGHKS